MRLAVADHRSPTPTPKTPGRTPCPRPSWTELSASVGITESQPKRACCMTLTRTQQLPRPNHISNPTYGTSEDNSRKLGYSFEPVQVDPSSSSSTAAAWPGCSSATNLQTLETKSRLLGLGAASTSRWLTRAKQAVTEYGTSSRHPLNLQRLLATMCCGSVSVGFLCRHVSLGPKRSGFSQLIPTLHMLPCKWCSGSCWPLDWRGHAWPGRKRWQPVMSPLSQEDDCSHTNTYEVTYPG